MDNDDWKKRKGKRKKIDQSISINDLKLTSLLEQKNELPLPLRTRNKFNGLVHELLEKTEDNKNVNARQMMYIVGTDRE